MNKEKTKRVLDYFEELYPNAHCELNHRNVFELLVAVMLSAQTTDKKVNQVTPGLFEKYPKVSDFANASLEELQDQIKVIGLYRNKAKNLKAMAQELVENYQGEVPCTRKELESLPGVGRKTTNVVLSVGFNVPGEIDLAGIDLELAHVKQGREIRLKQALDKVKDYYDYVFIDCPPALGLLNTNALTSCDTVLIPVQCEYYALEGLTQLLNTIKLTQNHFNKKLSIEGLLLTMLDQRTNLGLEVSQEVRKYFKEKVYKTVIPRNIKLSEAPSAGICIFDYDGSSVGAQAYKELAKEVLSRNG